MSKEASKPARHKWVKLKIRNYICKVCGCGRVNSEVDGVWVATWHTPDGKSRVEHHTPPCVVGPRTAAYLAKYAKEISEWKGVRNSINMNAPVTDAAEADRVTEQAIQQVDDNTDETWKYNVLAKLEMLARVRAEITSDDLWNYVGSAEITQCNPSALGAVFRMAAERGYIELIENYWKESERPDTHRRPLRVWKSKLIPQEPHD